MSSNRRNAKMAPDGAAQTQNGWTPKGTKSYPMVSVVRKADGCEMCIREADFDSEVYSKEGEVPAPIAKQPEPARKFSQVQLAGKTLPELRAMPEWLAVPEDVRALATTKGEIIDAIMSNA